MPAFVYILIWLSLLKILLDFFSGDLLAPYSVVLENIQYALLLGIIIISVIKKRGGRRELLQEKIKHLKEMHFRGQ